jgi:hypothetical protein
MQVHTITTSYGKTIFALMAIGLNSVVIAQPPATHRPGETVTLAIAFDGVDARRLKNVSADLSQPPGEVTKDQAGFSNEFHITQSALTGPKTFTLSGRIPSNIASGTYTLTQVRATGVVVDAGGGIDAGHDERLESLTVTYNEGLPAFKVRIENRGRFTKPSITPVKDLTRR